MGAFISSIFGGSNPVLGKDMNHLGDLGSFSSNVGEGDTTAASDYNKGILSGDPAQVAETLAPEIKANQQQAQQQKNTMAQFGQRSGGNTSAASNIDSSGRSNIIDLIGKLRQGAAGQLANIGQNNLADASSNFNDQAKLSQEQLENFQNSILGKGIGGAVNYAESFLPIAHGG